jgi:TonB family protein
MTRLLSVGIALALIASSECVLAQGHVLMTPELIEANRKFTTYAPFPQYSASAQAHHLEGSGLFLLHLRSDGSVSRVDVVQSTGHRELDDACISTYRQWRFRQNFAAKAHKVKIPVTFKMPG